MNNLNDNGEVKIWRGWIRIWVVPIPIWIGSLALIWFIVDDFVHLGTLFEQGGVVIYQAPSNDINMIPASGPVDSTPAR